MTRPEARRGCHPRFAASTSSALASSRVEGYGAVRAAGGWSPSRTTTWTPRVKRSCFRASSRISPALRGSCSLLEHRRAPLPLMFNAARTGAVHDVVRPAAAALEQAGKTGTSASARRARWRRLRRRRPHLHALAPADWRFVTTGLHPLPQQASSRSEARASGIAPTWPRAVDVSAAAWCRGFLRHCGGSRFGRCTASCSDARASAGRRGWRFAATLPLQRGC